MHLMLDNCYKTKKYMTAIMDCRQQVVRKSGGRVDGIEEAFLGSSVHSLLRDLGIDLT
jgi:hypothetical protein